VTAKDVHAVILARLPALGSPGERFFPDPDTDRERAWALIAREYVEALEQFDRPTLERAFARVRDQNTTGFWPSPGKFRQAALSLATPEPDANAARRDAAEQRAGEYVARFMKTSKLLREARKDGWAGELLAYVQAAASVQAQVIAGTKGISWDAALLDPASDAAPGEQIDALVAECRERGLAEVKVQVPRDRVKAWRAHASAHPAKPEQSEWQEIVQRLGERKGRGGGPG
jgi:hypothetical protein